MRTVVTLLLVGAAILLLSSCPVARADDGFEAWYNSDKWHEAGDATLDPGNSRRLVGKPGTGVLINGRDGKCPSLVTRRRDYRDVEIHLEFMVAKGSNSGVIFHGNHEIQILDSYGIEKPTAGHCGGIYPRAEAKPKYRHIDKGSPPRVNAAKPPGQWQTFDIIFQAARFDENGKKTAHARFVRVVHNGVVIQENHEVPYASGPNWDRKQFPQGPIILQGDYGPIAFRNVRVRPWKGDDESQLNVPPEGFTALFNGKDLAGWHTPPLVKEYWSVEDGVLKSPGLIKTWGACLATKKQYRDFVLMLDFRMPTISDSGINFRRLIPKIPGFGNMEQFNLRSKGGMGHLESYYFLPKETAKKMGLKKEEKPRVRHIDPEVGVWHTVKLTMQGRTFSAEYDGELIHDHFKYHDWMINMEPAPIRLQKHIVVHGQNLGKENPCPIEYRNIFIKELKPGAVDGEARPRANAAAARKPPEGFATLFNGRDFTGWRVYPKVKKMWSIEDGVLKSHGLLEQWGADLTTTGEYRDFVLLVDFRMPTASDSGIHFRKLIPDMGNFGQTEQLNIGTGRRMGQLESLNFMLANMKDKAPIKREDLPKIGRLDPEVGAWHTVKITMIGQTITAELDGKVMIDKYEYPKGILGNEAAPIRFQKHRFLEYRNGKKNPCPIEYRNIFIKEIQSPKSTQPSELNTPPEGFTALFNGRDLTGWRVSPKVREFWSVEDEVLKSPGLLREWGACLVTEKKYRDFVLMLDFRMPTLSASGINFRRLIPKMGGLGQMEQFTLRSKGGTGHLESLHSMPKDMKRKMGLKEKDCPKVRHIDPEVGVWHTVKLTMIGRTLSAELDGEVLYDKYEYPKWLLSAAPAPIRLKKYVFVDGHSLGKMNPCPIEFRKIFIKEIGPGTVGGPTKPRTIAAAEPKAPRLPASRWVGRWKSRLHLGADGAQGKWAPGTGAADARLGTAPFTLASGQTIHVASLPVSQGDGPPVVLQPGSTFRIRGRIASAHAVYFGITVKHPNGDFAGRFQTIRPAAEFRSGEGFETTFRLQDLQLDPSFDDVRDTLPTSPAHFVVESIWCHTLDKQAGLEIAEVELIPPDPGATQKAPVTEKARVGKGSAATSPREPSGNDQVLTAKLPPELPLWKGPVPGGVNGAGVEEQVRSHRAPAGSPSGLHRAFSFVSSPTYSIHRPENPNGVGLVICPGGGFRDVWIDREGHDLALWLKKHNVTCLVLKYRTRLDNGNIMAGGFQKYLRAARADARQAIRVLRGKAPDLGLQGNKIGICGFSAGGLLALSCALRPEPSPPEGEVAGMPDFAGLFYPGIPDNASRLIENRATAGGDGPGICPIFIVNARDDKETPADKCVEFYAALLRAGVNAELHVLNQGAHGFGLGAGRGESAAIWPTSFASWLRDTDMIQD